MDFSGLTNIEDRYFSIELDSINTRTDNYNARLEIEIFLDRDIRVINRSVYNFLMFLGDIGGLSGLLYSVCASLLGLLSVSDHTGFLISSLYRFEKSKRTFCLCLKK